MGWWENEAKWTEFLQSFYWETISLQNKPVYYVQEELCYVQKQMLCSNLMFKPGEGQIKHIDRVISCRITSKFSVKYVKNI